MSNKVISKYQNFLKQKDEDNKKIVNKLLKIINTTAVYTNNIELIEDVEYKDIIKLWDLFKFKNKELFKSFVNNVSIEDEKKYLYYYKKFNILDDLFKAHLNKKEHLILFHIKNEDISLCKLHSESLWDEIYNGINKDNILKYQEYITQIPFWNIELNIPGVKQSFLKFLNNTDIDKCIHISCFCLD